MYMKKFLPIFKQQKTRILSEFFGGLLTSVATPDLRKIILSHKLFFFHQKTAFYNGLVNLTDLLIDWTDTLVDSIAQKNHLFRWLFLTDFTLWRVLSRVYDKNTLSHFHFFVKSNFRFKRGVEMRGVEPLQPGFVDSAPHRRTPTLSLVYHKECI